MANRKALSEWLPDLQAQNGILSAQDCNDIREAMHMGVFDDVRMNQIFNACGLIDFANSHRDIDQIFIDVIVNYAFDDDPPDPEPVDYVYDVITKQKGDFLNRELPKITTLPTSLLNATLVYLRDNMGGNESSKLQATFDAL